MPQLGYIVDVSGIPDSKRYECYKVIERGSDVISTFDPRLTEIEVYYDENSSITGSTQFAVPL